MLTIKEVIIGEGVTLTLIDESENIIYSGNLGKSEKQGKFVIYRFTLDTKLVSRGVIYLFLKNGMHTLRLGFK